MLKSTALGLATAASLSFGAAALTPALAAEQGQGLVLVNYSLCDEQPEAKGCPGFIPPAATLGMNEYTAPAKKVTYPHAHHAAEYVKSPKESPKKGS